MNARHRAILFVDGSNWYHGCKRLGVREPGRIDFARVALKLVGPRLWVETRYYVGQVPEHGRRELSRRQHGFIARQKAMDQRFTVHFGRIEARRIRNVAAAELRAYLAALPMRIEPGIFHGLSAIASRHEISEFMVEKAVDVHLAMDLVLMAERDEFDTAYLLSADGDLTPAVTFALTKGKQVFVASASGGSKLAAACSRFLALKLRWFDDVMME